MRLLVAIGFVVGFGWGCSKDKNTLSGSIGQVYDLSFSSTRARLYNSEFAVEYVREDQQVPVRVVLDRPSGKKISTGSIELDDRGRIIGRIDERRLPAFESGTLQLESFRAKQGASVKGAFDGTLESGDSTYSIRGDFSTSLDVVDQSLGYESDAFEADDGGDAASSGDAYRTDGGS